MKEKNLNTQTIWQQILLPNTEIDRMFNKQIVIYGLYNGIVQD